MLFLKNFAKGLIFMFGLMAFLAAVVGLSSGALFLAAIINQFIVGVVGALIVFLVLVTAFITVMDLYFDKFEKYIDVKLGIK